MYIIIQTFAIQVLVRMKATVLWTMILFPLQSATVLVVGTAKLARKVRNNYSQRIY